MKQTPILSFSWGDYLDNYYGPKPFGGKHKGQQVSIAKKALKNLCDKDIKISYYRTRFNKEKAKYKYWIDYYGPLIIDRSGDRSQRPNNRNFTLAFHPLFIDAIKNFYVLKPVSLISDIKNFRGINRVKKPVLLFIEWLLTKNKSPYVIAERALIERLWLENLIQSGHPSRLRAILDECFETAEGLGYLAGEVVRDGAENLVFELNPEKCSRVNKQT